jgi:4-carboxymuconolactone decarboxylase
MNDANKQIINEFLAHSDEIADDILKDIEAYFGRVPFIMEILRERPDAFVLDSLGDMFMSHPESLDLKTVELICIAAAAAIDAQHCLKMHIGSAISAGATREELIHTIVIASLVGKTKILASSLRTIKDAMARDDIPE